MLDYSNEVARTATEAFQQMPVPLHIQGRGLCEDLEQNEQRILTTMSAGGMSDERALKEYLLIREALPPCDDGTMTYGTKVSTWITRIIHNFQ